MEQRIRAATASDAPAVRIIYGPFVSDNATSFETVVPDVAEMEGRIQAHADRYPWLVSSAASARFSATPTRRRIAPVPPTSGAPRSPSMSTRGRTAVASGGRSTWRCSICCDASTTSTPLPASRLPNPSSVGLHEAMGFSPESVSSGRSASSSTAGTTSRGCSSGCGTIRGRSRVRCRWPTCGGQTISARCSRSAPDGLPSAEVDG